MEKKKLDGRTILVASALFIAIFAQIGFIGSVVAPVGQPHNIWGTTSKAGNSPPGLDITTNRTITAWIDGVSYGYNWTTASGSYDLDVYGDTWGVAEDNAFKDGGYPGDDIYYFLDYDPMDYYLSISTTTSIFVEGGFELVDPIYFDTQTNIDNLVDTYLRGIKINEVIVDPSDGYPDYVILYDPGGELSHSALTDANKGYYLEKDDEFTVTSPSPPTPRGEIFDFNTYSSYVEAYGPGLNYYYINLTGFDLDEDDDGDGELKLVWKNPPNWGGSPTVDEICNHTDVIVDRVEWGNHINHIDPPDDNRDYDNTTMGDFSTAIGPGESMIRSTNGTDTDDCDADFTLQGVANPRPREGVIPPTVDYVCIFDRPWGTPGAINLSDPANYPTYWVGYSTTFYAYGFNDTTGFIGAVSGDWGSDDLSLVTVSPSTGQFTDITCDNVNWGGPATITFDYQGLGSITNTTEIMIMQPTVDTIEITTTPGGTPLSDATVSDGSVIWGFASGYNDTAGYIGLVTADWEVGGGNAALVNGTPNIHAAIDVGNMEVDVWLNASSGSASDSVKFTVTISIIPNSWPGAPSNLRVHKGPWMGYGTSSDLVLNWTSPGWNYTSVKYNIVYYDMDISDGFQYTLFMLFKPNSTSGNSEDGCVLPGFLADPDEYCFVVRCTNDTQGSWENLTGTDVGYKYDIELQANLYPLTSQMVVSIPYNCDLKKASDIAGGAGAEFSNGDIIGAVLKWNYSTQQWDYWTWYESLGIWFGTVDYAIEPGDAIVVGITTASPYTWKIVGSHDDSVDISFLANPGLSQMYTSIPYHKIYEIASDVAGPGTEFENGDVIGAVLQWNYSNQRYDYWTWYESLGIWFGIDFTLYPPPGCHIVFGITALSPYVWQPQVITI